MILDSKDAYMLTDKTRELGFLVARGTTVSIILFLKS